mmetsp:Transcript_24515/g.53703  ORF Transcript_24515/g.53703 Transcript_24515/m.53703 type:complete len:237 (-) Transcript_24515:724-1434(-)
MCSPMLGKVSSMVDRKDSIQATKSRSCVTVRSGSLCPSVPPIWSRICLEQTWATHVLHNISRAQLGGKQGDIWFCTNMISAVSSFAALRMALKYSVASSSSSSTPRACATSWTSRKTSRPRNSKSWYICLRAEARMSVNRRFWALVSLVGLPLVLPLLSSSSLASIPPPPSPCTRLYSSLAASYTSTASTSATNPAVLCVASSKAPPIPDMILICISSPSSQTFLTCSCRKLSTSS